MNTSDDRFWSSQVSLMRQRHPELFRPPGAKLSTTAEPKGPSNEPSTSPAQAGTEPNSTLSAPI
jgi:hypothetical protein